jgi:hypothetical protein
MLVFHSIGSGQGNNKTSDIVSVVERQRFLLSKGVNYDRAWDNCGPDLRIYLLEIRPKRLRRDALLTGRQAVPACFGGAAAIGGGPIPAPSSLFGSLFEPMNQFVFG